MRSLSPEQIVLLLLFVLVPLFNVLVRWLQQRARAQQRPPAAEPRAAEPTGYGERAIAPMPPRVRLIEPALPPERPREARPAPRVLPVVRRAGPLGGRVAVRRAIVAMAILGPCRGLEPPSSDPRRPRTGR